MSCVPADRRFRLLDAYVGWDSLPAPDGVVGLTGLDDPGGITLARLTGAGLPWSAINSRIAPGRIARACGPCDWILATKAPPCARLLALGACDNIWKPLAAGDCGTREFSAVAGIAVALHRLIVAEAAPPRLWILALDGSRILGEAALPSRPLAIAVSPRREILVALEAEARLKRFDLSGRARGWLDAALPPGPVERMAFDMQGRLWLVTRAADGGALLWHETQHDFIAAGLETLHAAFAFNGLACADEHGFCIERPVRDAVAQRLCFNWYGRAVDPGCAGDGASAIFVTQGQLLTGPIDSGQPRCRWHRLRLDADIPSGTSLEVAVSTSEDPAAPAQGVAVAPWAAFPVGLPHPDDWQVIASDTQDALMRQPAGRYLFLRLRLTGDGLATPVVRRIHLDFPRATSADLLPAVYREEPESTDFTERFMSLFDAVLEEIDSATTRFPALLDTQRTPEDVLPWVASFLGFTLDLSWDAGRRRAILGAAPALFRRRGTVQGLLETIRIVFGVDAVIEEHGATRNWGAIASRSAAANPAAARLNATRLFGRGRARMKLGASLLGGATLRSQGNPDDDPHYSGAFRFSVAVPTLATVRPEVLRRLVEDQKPAHTIAQVLVGSRIGPVFSPAMRLGVDTLFGVPPPAALGTAMARLNARAVLRARVPLRDGLRLGAGASSC